MHVVNAERPCEIFTRPRQIYPISPNFSGERFDCMPDRGNEAFSVWMLFECLSYFRRIFLRLFTWIWRNHGILLKTNSATGALIISCRNFPNKYSWERHSWLLLFHFHLLSGRFSSSVWILRTMYYPLVDAHPGHSQASKLDLFARIANGF